MKPPPTAASTGQEEQLRAAIQALPAFLSSPIFLPTERVPPAEAIAGLAQVRALYAYDLDLTHRPRLQALKAARRRRRCFVIGNGPSLGRTDLSRLEGEATFATNGFFLKMPELDWVPTYYVVEDHLVGEDRAAELNRLRGTTKLFPASLAYALRPDADTIFFDHRPRPSFPDGFDFSFDADVSTYTGGTVTFTCLQLAAYLGYQEIYLIGVDADYAIPVDAALSGSGRIKEIDMASDDPNHFHPDYFGKGKRWHEPNVATMLAAYEEARRATEARGISIVNATVGGKLEVFPRIDYETLFRPEPTERLLVIDHTQMGDATATGEVKAAVLGHWPEDRLMQVYDRGHGRPRIAGDPTDHADPDVLAARIAHFDPDVVLYRPVPGRDALHELALRLVAETPLPLALWIMDDWPSALAGEDPDRAAALDADLRWLLDRADTRLSISAAMSTAFHERYGASFTPIANGIDPDDWPLARLRPPGHVTVRYAGGLADNMTLASVGAVARAVEQLAEAGLDIGFEIRTHRHWRSDGSAWLEELRHTSVSTSDLPRPDYRSWLADADILLIAYNFDARSRDYIRYSLANKLPECLASGSAVLAIGPEDVATIALMAQLDVGELVTVDDDGMIAETLRYLAESPTARLELGERGQEVAFSLFSVSEVRQAFDAAIARAASVDRAAKPRAVVAPPPRPRPADKAATAAAPAGSSSAGSSSAGSARLAAAGAADPASPVGTSAAGAGSPRGGPRSAPRRRPLPTRLAALLWRRRRWTIPAAAVLVGWALLGFVPALAGVSWLIWGSAALAAIALPGAYAVLRLRARTRRLRRQVSRLQAVQERQRKRIDAANARIGRLERHIEDGASINANLLQKVGRLEETMKRRRRS